MPLITTIRGVQPTGACPGVPGQAALHWSVGVYACAAGCAALVYASPLSSTAVPLAGSWVWVLALLVAGMPHGAWDLVEIRRRSGSTTGTLGYFGVYSLLMLGFAALYWVLPVATLIAFLGLTVVHFGLSDVSTSCRDRRWTLALGHGAIVVGSPFVFWPEASWAPFAELALVIRGDGTLPPEALRATAISVVVLGWLAVLLGTARALRRGSRGWAVRLLITPMIASLASIALPPLLAVGLYFVCVHATGHCLRVGGSDQAPLRAFVRTHVQSSALLVPSLAITGVLAVPFSEHGLVPALALAFLLFCVMATPPHHMLWFMARPRTIASTVIARALSPGVVRPGLVPTAVPITPRTPSNYLTRATKSS